MSKKDVCVYTNMNSIEKRQYVKAIFDINKIKYFDLQDKFIVDFDKNMLIKENNESIIKIFFNNSNILIYVKEFNVEYEKEMELLELINNNHAFYIKYRLIDENVVNEYKIDF